LVTALDSALSDESCLWVGWSGRACDDINGGEQVPAQLHQCELLEVPLTSEEVASHYEGFCNATLWPLYHDAVAPVVYHRGNYETYHAINRRFCDIVASEAPRGALVWVHDYQLQLLPDMLRRLRPDIRIGFFLHIPFPPPELFRRLPWRKEILNGLMGADVIGFQTEDAVDNFVATVNALTTATAAHGFIDVPATPNAAERKVAVGAFPISIDSEHISSLAQEEASITLARKVRSDLGDPRILLLGVDRLDYTKGIEMRLQAIVELIEEGSLDPYETVFLQIASPSRQNVEQYQRIREQVEGAIGRAVGDLSRLGTSPIQYLYQSMPSDDLVAFYMAADVMLVTPLRDGMNLVAKEYVAARVKDDGALVLSEFAGAARQLTDAWLINPYDMEAMKHAILRAVRASKTEKARRMSGMRQVVMHHDVQRWSQDFLSMLSASTAQQIIDLRERAGSAP
jgi:alpha,alpha-trehalose-phosphate synthase [UDP-forming]